MTSHVLVNVPQNVNLCLHRLVGSSVKDTSKSLVVQVIRDRRRVGSVGLSFIQAKQTNLHASETARRLKNVQISSYTTLYKFIRARRRRILY